MDKWLIKLEKEQAGREEEARKIREHYRIKQERHNARIARLLEQHKSKMVFIQTKLAEYLNRAKKAGTDYYLTDEKSFNKEEADNPRCIFIWSMSQGRSRYLKAFLEFDGQLRIEYHYLLGASEWVESKYHIPIDEVAEQNISEWAKQLVTDKRFPPLFIKRPEKLPKFLRKIFYWYYD